MRRTDRPASAREGGKRPGTVPDGAFGDWETGHGSVRGIGGSGLED